MAADADALTQPGTQPVPLLVPISEDPYAPRPPSDLPYSDGEPLDSPWHVAAINLLIESVKYHFRDRKDFFTGGDMFLYYSTERVFNRDFRGPDFLFVSGVDRDRPRNYYAVWDEDGRYPEVIMELLSPTTAAIDRGVKKLLYQDTFRTPEYFLYDPAARTLEGFRLGQGDQPLIYQPIAPNERGFLWSTRLGLWVGPWTGEYQLVSSTWPRFYTSEGNLVQTRGEAEHQRAEAERQRAEAERQRAEAAEAELERLRQELAALRQGPGPQP